MIASLLGALAVVATPTRAEAHGFDFRPQVALELRTLLPEARAFGGLEAAVSASIMGFGISTGAGWERFTLSDGGEGGYLAMEIQVHPLVWMAGRTFSQVNLRIGVGGLLGGVTPETFRGGFVTSLGVDIALWHVDDFEPHPMLSVGFRSVAPSVPDDATQVFMMIGVGARLAR